MFAFRDYVLVDSPAQHEANAASGGRRLVNRKPNQRPPPYDKTSLTSDPGQLPVPTSYTYSYSVDAVGQGWLSFLTSELTRAPSADACE